jgi:hypothetical protein
MGFHFLTFGHNGRMTDRPSTITEHADFFHRGSKVRDLLARTIEVLRIELLDRVLTLPAATANRATANSLIFMVRPPYRGRSA